ncbi:LOW QUALITY PROTEIN: calpain-14 [Trichechus inunguis]
MVRKNLVRSCSQLPKQDYQALLESCLRNYCLEDESFPATPSSIGCIPLLQKLPPRMQWKRPRELYSNSQFYSAKAKRLDLCQGVVGDYWFLASLQALTLHQDFLSRVILLNSFTEKYGGVFQFWFWQFGNWVPVNEAGQLVFVSSTYKNFWGTLLEKAYAKFSVSYEDLQFRQVSEALVDFTEGMTVIINLAEAGNLWDILTRTTYSRTLIGCQTHSGKERVLQNWLVNGLVYTLTGIRNSSTWELLHPKKKILLLRKDDDGQFWNLQFLLSVWKSELGRKLLHPSSRLVSLLQKPRHRHHNQRSHLAIGFYLFKTHEIEKEVNQELWLNPGTFIMPCTSEVHQKSEFILRVFSRKHIFYEIGSHSSVVFSKGSSVSMQEFRDLWMQLMLYQHLLWSPSGLSGGVWECLTSLAFGCGSLQEIFHKQDSHHSGYLNWDQLRAATKEAGRHGRTWHCWTQNYDVCKLMLIRYGPSLQTDFLHFVYLMLRAENMEDVFQNLTQNGKGIYLHGVCSHRQLQVAIAAKSSKAQLRLARAGPSIPACGWGPDFLVLLPECPAQPRIATSPQLESISLSAAAGKTAAAAAAAAWRSISAAAALPGLEQRAGRPSGYRRFSTLISFACAPPSETLSGALALQTVTAEGCPRHLALRRREG